jgi:hypothetical protein
MAIVHGGGRNEDTESFEGVYCDHETDKALHCIQDVQEDGDLDPFWVPKSVVDDDSQVYQKGHRGTLVVKHWWAAKNGMV